MQTSQDVIELFRNSNCQTAQFVTANKMIFKRIRWSLPLSGRCSSWYLWLIFLCLLQMLIFWLISSRSTNEKSRDDLVHLQNLTFNSTWDAYVYSCQRHIVSELSFRYLPWAHMRLKNLDAKVLLTPKKLKNEGEVNLVILVESGPNENCGYQREMMRMTMFNLTEINQKLFV